MLFPNVISGKGIPRLACNASHWDALEIGFVEAVMRQFPIRIEREFGDSSRECFGRATAGFMIGLKAGVALMDDGGMVVQLEPRRRFFSNKPSSTCHFYSNYNNPAKSQRQCSCHSYSAYFISF